ncbi:hypothetical protein [Spiroplasma ixodetis]|uniref:hypothetical protein n=1 Tax=Spiroplasma ixodetis TaxID=2141 RepID=UPI0025775E6C|nr:hypothetical protein [Spiroplasma ixodetis]
MKYLINSADFTKFDYKFNKFVEKYKNDKNINKVNIYYRKFRKFCFIFKNKNSCKEIISQLHMPKQTFYYWAKRFYDIFYKNKPFEELLFKAFLPLCTIFKFYHINVEKSLSTDFSPHF